MAEPTPETNDGFMSIVYCPCCCSNLDAEGTGDQKFECNNCGTSFSVTIEEKKFAEHSMNS